MKDGVIGDVTSRKEMTLAAKGLTKQCVQDRQTQGGVISGFGMRILYHFKIPAVINSPSDTDFQADSCDFCWPRTWKESWYPPSRLRCQQRSMLV